MNSSAASYLPPPLAKLLPYYVLVLAVLAAYLNNSNNEFLAEIDDYSTITNNVFLRDWHTLANIFLTSTTSGGNVSGGFYRPLQILAYFFVYQIAGVSVFAFHFLNTGLHAANACLTYALGRKLNFKPAAVFTAALIWAMHPLHVEAITYMTGTADPLYTFFCLLGIISLLPDFAPRKFWTASFLFLLALLSKESAIAFPFLVVGTIYCFGRERSRLKTCLSTWPLWSIGALYVLFRIYVMNFGNYALQKGTSTYTENIFCRIETFLAMLPSYARLIIWPVKLHFFRDFSPVTDPLSPAVLAGFVMVLIMAQQILFSSRRRVPALGWGFMWFLAAYLPYTGILKPLNALLLEHWMYLPTIGLFLGIAEASVLAAGRLHLRIPERAGIAVCIAVAVVLGEMTYKQNEVWEDTVSLSQNALAKLDENETPAQIYVSLGTAYEKRGEIEMALQQFRYGLELNGENNASLQNDYAATLHREPNVPAHANEIIEHLKKALDIDPDFYMASNNLAKLYRELGNNEQASFYDAMARATRKRLTHISDAAP